MSLQIKMVYSEHLDSAVRFEVAKLLINFTNGHGEKILRQLAKDQDSLVRIEAWDSLSVSCSLETFNLLKKIIKSDRNGIVRGYAIKGYVVVKG